MIAIIDYDAGNIKSVEKAVIKLGYDCVITRDKEVLKKADKLILPVVLLVLSVGGLVYMYIGGTFNSIYSWFTSTAEETKHLPSELNRGVQYDELIANYGMLVIAGLLVIIALIGLVILFKRIGRKFSSKD